jgi:hypothetical protein
MNRPTADIIADLRRRIATPWLMTEAADRLEELDRELDSLTELFGELQS